MAGVASAHPVWSALRANIDPLAGFQTGDESYFIAKGYDIPESVFVRLC